MRYIILDGPDSANQRPLVYGFKAPSELRVDEGDYIRWRRQRYLKLSVLGNHALILNALKVA
jgi:hypothetical protein